MSKPVTFKTLFGKSVVWTPDTYRREGEVVVNPYMGRWECGGCGQVSGRAERRENANAHAAACRAV